MPYRIRRNPPKTHRNDQTAEFIFDAYGDPVWLPTLMVEDSPAIDIGIITPCGGRVMRHPDEIGFLANLDEDD